MTNNLARGSPRKDFYLIIFEVSPVVSDKKIFKVFYTDI